ncbi:MAG: M14 family metallocarboxypeptidase [Clostridia bacterium]|nr:M14 family metallocarboxypeptidase [Clostridia bacterium]
MENENIIPIHVPFTYKILELTLDRLKMRYPFLQIDSIGKSIMKKHIYCIRIGKGKKELFYNAAHHANEWITTPLLLKFLEDYAKAYSQNGDINLFPASKLYESTSLYIVPLVNPDGVDLVNGAISKNSKYYKQAYQIAQNYRDIPFPDGWKANITGTDLNLNYPAGWENAKIIKFSQGFTSPAPRDYTGPAPLSEPESQAVYNLTKDHNFKLILAYHTQGNTIYWKYLDYMPEKSYEIAQNLGKASGYAIEETPITSGYAGYKDWFIQTYNRPGYTIEAGMGENPLSLSKFSKIYEDNIKILTTAMLPPI